MWILHFLPDSVILWFVNILLLAGILLTIAGWFAHRIPLIYQYQLPFKIVGVLLLVLGVYFRGGYAIETEWRERVTELEQKLKVAEAESAKVNEVIKEKIVTKTQVIREKGETIIQRVEVLKDAACPVPQEAIDVHNEAARMNQAIEAARKAAK
jgi:type VI protein secretion system component VasK